MTKTPSIANLNLQKDRGHYYLYNEFHHKGSLNVRCRPAFQELIENYSDVYKAVRNASEQTSS